MKKLVLTALVSSTFPLAAQAYPAFECLGQKSGNFYSATILDVGDEDGEVTANNGGAPQNFRANYREVSEGRHNWVFGYELYDEGIVPVLSELTLKIVSDKKAIGKVSYFEHDYSSQSHRLIKEKVVCEVTEE